MPNIKRADLYQAILEVARERFADAQAISPYLTTRSEGSPLYRYVGYRNSEPQIEESGRKIWTSLESDTANRWTGRGSGQTAEGKQGIYLSGEYLDIEKPFPELEHYIKKDANVDDPVFYFRYEQGAKPELILAKAGELRSMFLFTAKNDLTGINLSLSQQGDHPLLRSIFIEARNRHPEAFTDADSLASLYNAGEDASFCRAIGNAAIEKTGTDFFQTTSVRDQLSSNIIMGGEPGVAVAPLTPQGRASFFLSKQGSVEGVFTVLDLQYNELFEQTGLGVLPSRQEIEANLKSIASQMTEKLIDAYQEGLGEQAPTEKIEQIGERLEALRTTLASDNISDALTQVGEIQGQIAEFKTAGPLETIEVASFKTVGYVMEALKSITKTIDVAQNEPIEDPDEISDEIRDIDFTDPDNNAVEPKVAED